MAAICDQLNDFLLQKLFAFLPVRDLSNAGAVCKRFKHNAVEVFASKHSKLDILKLIDQDWLKEWYMVRWMTEKFLKSVVQLFVHFGSHIKTLRLQGTGANGEGMDENKLLLLVKTYCTALKELTLCAIGKEDNFTADLLPLFGRLEKLSLFGNSDHCSFSDSFVLLLADCLNVKHLTVNDVPTPVWIYNKFPSLETLDISNNWEFDFTAFEAFLISHDTLRTLRYENDFIVSDVFAMLSKGPMKLETFRCKYSEMWDYDDEVDEHVINENILQLSKLKSLKCLTFTCDESSMKLLVDALRKENSPIEQLEIVDCNIDNELVIALSEFQSLKSLTLTQCEMAKDATLNTLNDGVIVKNIKKIKIFRPYQQSAEILTILNDDCLIKILEYLPLSDLCNAADACQRFRQNAQTVFQLHYTCFNTDAITERVHYTDYIDMALAERLFRNFGFFIRELTLKGTDNLMDDETMLFLATKYCISISFQALTLIRITIKGPMRWIFPLLGMFHTLPKLDLHLCRLDKDFGRFLSICQIPTIQVFQQFTSTEWMQHTFWHLQILIVVEIWISDAEMRDFIKLNGHLQSLVIFESNLSSTIFRNVAKRMPGLRQFYFAGKHPKAPSTRRNVLHLGKCKLLSSLMLNCSSFSVGHLMDEFIKEGTPIAELCINSGTIDTEVVEKLALIQSLRSFSITRTKMNNVSLVDLVKKLPELNELSIDIMGVEVKEIIKILPHAQNLSKLSIGSERSHVEIGVVDYKAILEIVKSRERPLKLCITIESEQRQVCVPVNLLEANGYWLKLDNEIVGNLIRSVDSDSDAEDSDMEVDMESGEESSESSEDSSGESDDDIDMEQ